MNNVIISIEQLNKTSTFEQELNELFDNKVEKITSSGFDGISLVMFMLSAGGGVLVTQLANIIIKLIEKNECKNIKIDDIEITGYSTNDVSYILEQIFKFKNPPKA